VADSCRLPAGTHDQGPAEREKTAYLAAKLASLFAVWGYCLVEPPVFEYYETFRTGAPSFAEQRAYRFLDRNGRLLALRPEMTTGIARMVASAVAGRSPEPGQLGGMPLRLAYQGPVFRNEPAGAGRPHSFWQAGIELIGETAPEADAEVIALAAASARALGFGEVRVVMGHAGLAWKALSACGADPGGGGERFRAIVANRDLVGLEQLLGRPMASLFAGGPYGPAEAPAVLARLAGLSEDLSADAGAVGLLLNAVAGYGCPDVALDLVLLRDLDYYTGAVFDLLVPGLAEPLGGGGRYDRLLARFGARLAATGFALNLSAAAALSPAARPKRTRVAVASANRDELPLALQAAEALRGIGQIVEVIPGDADLRGAMRAAAGHGIRKLLYFEEKAYREIDLAQAGAEGIDRLHRLRCGQGIH